MNILYEIRVVAGQMSPYLLFGFLMAGVLHVFVSPSWMRRHLGGRGMLPVLKSVLMGVPLPLCSCGVIAVTASMRRQGAGRGAATGFLLATPQTGVDSIAATWGMMGPVLGVFRPIMALITGIAGGCIAAFFDKGDAPVAVSEKSCSDGCEEAGSPRTIAEVLRYGLVTLPRDIAKPLVVGIIIAGFIAALTPRDLLAPYIGGGILAMLIMTVMGIPLYVCATSSIPIALSFIHLGASPGAALAFLIAGPATNAATIATVWKVMGKTTAAIYLSTVFVGAIISGLLFDILDRVWDIPMVYEGAVEGHTPVSAGMNIFWALLLAGVVLHSIYGDRLLFLWKKKAGSIPLENAEGICIKLTLTGMTCSHCAAAVTNALNRISGVENTEVEFASGSVTVRGDTVSAETLITAVEELGYKVTLTR